MNAIQLLAEAAKEHPELATFPWEIRGDKAVANLGQLSGTYLEPDPGNPGKQTLVVIAAPKAVPVVNKLHAAGWRRGDIPQGHGFWVVYADLKRDGAHIRVAGLVTQEDREVGHDNTSVPFFAPEPPPLPARGRLGKKVLAEYREWERKCYEDEW